MSTKANPIASIPERVCKL